MFKQRRRSVARSVEEAHVELGQYGCQFLLKRSSARRTLALRVGEDGRVTVNAPLTMPQQQIDSFLRRHAEWLRARLATTQSVLLWRPGMSLPYLGEELTLRWTGETAQGIQMESRNLSLGGDWGQVPARVQAWYRQQAAAHLGPRVRAISAQHGLDVPPLRLSDARSRWGSLSAKGVVGLNWRLIKASPAEIDYVICHELAHFRHRNHSPAFWREVARLYPEYPSARARLRNDGRRYFQF